MPEKTDTLNEKDISLGALFPDDDLSRAAIPAFIIRADLWLEMNRLSVDDEMHNRKKGPVLFSDQFYSRFYYFRGTLRSTHSAHETLNRLSKNAAFQSLLAKYDRTERFEDLRGTAARVFEDVARMRNYFAAHCEDIGLGLHLMNQNRELEVQRGEVGLSDSIAGSILIESMFLKLKKDNATKTKEITRLLPAGTPIPDEAFPALLNKLSEAAYAAFEAVDLATTVYLQERAPP